MLRRMSRLFIALLLAAVLGACSRTSSDPALAKNPAPLTDCSDDAFVSILGGGKAVVCTGENADPQVRACLEAPFTRGAPFAHVVRRPGQPVLITVRTPEQRVFQVRRFAEPGGERVDLFSCRPAPEMPQDELPFFCPLPGDNVAPVQRGKACDVLERARKLRRSAAERAAK